MNESNGRFASLCADGCYLGELLRRLLSSLSSNRYLVERDAGLADLVSFRESERLPIHRWFRYKEGFSPRLIDFVADAFGRNNLGSVLDVFAGVGTTALSVQTSRRLKVSSALGIEYNPLISDIASMKLDWWKANAERLRPLAERAVDGTDTSRDGHMPPAQATLTNDRVAPASAPPYGCEI